MTRTIALVTALLASLLTLPAAAHSLKDVEDMLGAREFYLQVVDKPAPDFSLLDAAGRPVKLADFRGKVVVLYFIYASCPDVCPLQSEKLANIQEDMKETPMRDLVQFVAITTDPVRDTANVLKEYGPAHGLDPANWIFLTSGPDDPAGTRELARRYGLEFTEEAGGEQMHGVVTHLIDKSGNLRARYHGLKFNATNFIVHVNALTNDTH